MGICFNYIFTARKRSLRRLCFYTCLSVILFTGGSTWEGPPGRYPLSRYTSGQVHTPGQVHPLGRYTPWAGTPPLGAVHAGRYGQQVGGTHPTGIHSCNSCFRFYPPGVLCVRDVDKNISSDFLLMIYLYTKMY